MTHLIDEGSSNRDQDYKENLDEREPPCGYTKLLDSLGVFRNNLDGVIFTFHPSAPECELSHPCYSS